MMCVRHLTCSWSLRHLIQSVMGPLDLFSASDVLRHVPHGSLASQAFLNTEHMDTTRCQQRL